MAFDHLEPNAFNKIVIRGHRCAPQKPVKLPFL